ncbi:MAG: NUDIX domain-containing protein [Pseudomonadota bacterium]
MPGPIPLLIRTANWVLTDGTKILAVRTRDRDRFYLPGGKIDAGESPQNALIREIHEELGVALIPDSLTRLGIFTGSGHNLPPDARIEMTCFSASYTGQFQPGREIAEYAWLGPADRHLMAPMGQQIATTLCDI